MAFDREDTLKKAEKLLRQGRLDAAIVEYARVVDDQPRDWATTNTLGDLYVRAGQPDKAIAQYSRVAEHFMSEGFYPKAAALYKKLLKLNPQDEAVHLVLADISQKQGLLADAKAYLNAVSARRRARGDRAGAAEIVVRLGAVDPSDFEARAAAARMLAEMGDEEEAAARFRGLHEDLNQKGRTVEALDALREAVRCNPYDHDGRVVLARAALAAGDTDGAREYLDRETAGADPVLLLALGELEIEARRFDEARDVLGALAAAGREEREQVIELAWRTVDRGPEAAYVVASAAVDAAAAAGEYDEAAALLQEFSARVPAHVPALLRLIEICVDGGLEATMYDAQAQLADAYLAAGQAAEARVIAEDLVAREPWERVHIDRFRRALVMLKVPEPDSLIAERLSGQVPFVARDPFADLRPDRSDAPPPADPPAANELPAPPPGPVEPPSPPVPPARGREGPPLEIDLTGALGSLDEEPRPSPPAVPRQPAGNLGEVFQDFRDEVSRQAAVDLSAQHMTLGRTYVDMGRWDEALEPLRIAARSPQYRFAAASLLGRIHADRGETTQAVEWLERAAEAPAPSAEEGRALLYDLGALVESRGETARALAIFLELQSEAGDYRDVAERVDRLSRVETGG